jgi:hypothetical protein
MGNKRMPGYNKSVVDSLGSVDDYGVKNDFPILDPVKKNRESGDGEIRLYAETATEAVTGSFTKTKTEEPNYFVEEKETKRGILKTVWPLRPYCKWCSPAAEREDDNEWTSDWSDDGAEIRLRKREARLKSYSFDQHYSFTLVERNGEVVCSICGNSSDEGDYNQEIQTVQVTKRKDPVIYDLESPEMGIKVDKSLARFPAELVSKWVEEKSLKSGTLLFSKEETLYSIPAADFLYKAVLDEANNEWLLGLTKCIKTPCLLARIEGDYMVARHEDIISWRKTALSVKHTVAAEQTGVTYTLPLSTFLARGESEGSYWKIALTECIGPYFMTTADIPEKRRSHFEVEMKVKSNDKQTDLFDF